MGNQSIDSKLLFAQNAINNSIYNAEINPLVAKFGYYEAKMQLGKGLYENAAELQNKHAKEYGEQYDATDALKMSKALANKTYMKHVKLARIGLKGDRGAAESLQLSGDRKTSISGWLKQANVFYANAPESPKVLEALAEYGITKQKLKAAAKLVEDVQAKYNIQLKEKGEAQTATQLRDEALDKLQDWIGEFIAVAHIALEDHPQYLEILGIVEPS